MNRWLLRVALALACLLALPHRCPAPIIYRAGEGWTYEPVGGDGGKWRRNRAKDQVQVAREAFEQKEYRTALKAARRVVTVWPLSDYAGEAQYLVGRCYEARRMDERAFKEYQRALFNYPKLANYDEILKRQFDIATRFLGGQWFKLWGYIPFFPSMEKTAGLFDTIHRNGPYHDTGPTALMNVGTAREKQKDYPKAVKAYERAADKYADRDAVASDALYKSGMAWFKQAKRADYDQSIAANSISTFQDLSALYPQDKRVPETANLISEMRTEQARGAFETAKFYERKKRYQGAVVYYNESLLKDSKSVYAEEARQKIEALKPKAEKQQKRIAEFENAIRASRTNLPAKATEPDKAKTPQPAEEKK
jgi:outer membrane protein assembly factor BamD (BamD/ComL family)